MEILEQVVDLFLHLDKHLDAALVQMGLWTYGLLALIVFCETGLVVTPFLPGDSLLFAAGAMAVLPENPLNLWILMVILTVAAIIGDTVNYHVGRHIGPKVFTAKSRWFKQEHLARTVAFYEKYGGKVIIMARFVPIIRTFAPFVAGIGTMSYQKFIAYNVIGGALWVVVCAGAGALFGSHPFVKANFSIVVLGIIFISVLPMAIEMLRARRGARVTAKPHLD